jgi:acetolactate synthase-1/2/3 large subunit
MPAVGRLPYFPESALDVLAPYTAAVLAGAHEPVTFFGYPGVPGRLLREGQERVSLCAGGQDEVAALRALADALDGPSAKGSGQDHSAAQHRPGLPSGRLTPEKVCLTLAALQPEGAIIVDEGLTTAFDYYGFSAGSPRHSLLTIAGGAIGYGMPCALGAALACPDRTVIDLQADGSALYTVQALWTEAREALPITTLICSNRSYRILEMELSRSGAGALGPAAKALTSLSPPAIDWVALGRGFGVASVAVDTVEGLAREMGRAFAEGGPHLIEMRL